MISNFFYRNGDGTIAFVEFVHTYNNGTFKEYKVSIWINSLKKLIILTLYLLKAEVVLLFSDFRIYIEIEMKPNHNPIELKLI